MSRIDFVRQDKQARKMLVNFLLDETGSMSDNTEVTISGVNEYITTLKNTQKKEGGQILFSLTKFNSEKIDLMHVAKPIEKVEHLTSKTYAPANNTPLYDAIGDTIKKVSEELVKHAKLVIPKVLFVILTDGEENSSHEYTKAKIAEMIKEKEKENWTFIYLGAKQDSWADAQMIGVATGNTMGGFSFAQPRAYSALSDSTAKYYCSSNTTTTDYFKETGYDEGDKKETK